MIFSKIKDSDEFLDYFFYWMEIMPQDKMKGWNDQVIALWDVKDFGM